MADSRLTRSQRAQREQEIRRELARDGRDAAEVNDRDAYDKASQTLSNSDWSAWMSGWEEVMFDEPRR